MGKAMGMVLHPVDHQPKVFMSRDAFIDQQLQKMTAHDGDFVTRFSQEAHHRGKQMCGAPRSTQPRKESIPWGVTGKVRLRPILTEHQMIEHQLWSPKNNDVCRDERSAAFAAAGDFSNRFTLSPSKRQGLKKLKSGESFSMNPSLSGIQSITGCGDAPSFAEERKRGKRVTGFPCGDKVLRGSWHPYKGEDDTDFKPQRLPSLGQGPSRKSLLHYDETPTFANY